MVVFQILHSGVLTTVAVTSYDTIFLGTVRRSQNFTVQLRRQIETLCDFALMLLRLCVYETFRTPTVMSRRTMIRIRDEGGWRRRAGICVRPCSS